MNVEQSPIPERIVLVSDTEGQQIEAQAQQQREKAYDGIYHWQEKPLEPFSIGREALYLQLRSMNAAVPLEVAVRHPESFLGDAILILFLCSHRPENLASVRHDFTAFFVAIDAWAEQNIPRRMATQAIGLALQILNDSDSTRAVPRPSGRENPDEGN